MKCLFAVVATAIFVVAAAGPTQARMRDNPNYGFCKSGTKVANIKNCKENGGTK